MFDQTYDEWTRKRGKAIIDHYGHAFFHGKRVLDLGAGHGEIGAMFLRLGADVTCVDAREENLREIRIKHPAIKTMRLDLEHEWPFGQHQYDIVLSLGLLCHLKNYEQHIKDICDVAEYIVLETEVLDTQNSDEKISIFEERLVNDLSFHGEGSIVSADNIQSRLSTIGATFKRLDNAKLNSGLYRYDWRESNSGRRPGDRRLWFVRRDKFIAAKLENQPRVKEIEDRLPRTESASNNSSHAKVLARIEQQRIRNENRQQNSAAARIAAMPQPSAIPQMNYPGRGKIRLYFNYYEESNPEKKKEIDVCFQKNIENQLLDVIVLQSDTVPTLNYFFDGINRLSGSNDINIICAPNTFFDDTVSLLSNIKHNELYALSGWNWQANGQSSSGTQNNQHVWIVRGRIENVDGNMYIDQLSCSGRAIYEFNKSGYTILDPSKSIKAYHYGNFSYTDYGPEQENSKSVMNIEASSLP